MSFRSKVEKQIEGFSREQIVFFVYLCATRALPFLGTKRNFIFWNDKDRQKHLYAIFNALDNIPIADAIRDVNGTDVYLKTTSVATAATNAAYAANDINAVSVANAAASAVGAARVAHVIDIAADAAKQLGLDVITACRSITADAITNAANAADAAAFMRRLETIILSDIKRIKKGQIGLFDNDVDVYNEVWQGFLDSLVAVGCVYWANLYEDLFANRFAFDVDEFERRLTVPVEIKEQGAAAVGQFLDTSKRQGVKRLNEARVVIIGDKGAGKTSLACKLLEVTCDLPSVEERTEGVDVMPWVIPEREGEVGVKVHIWDFAGHVITHAMHRFFLSERCVYIIVYDGGVNDRNVQTSIEYWLDHAKNYGGDSPVYIVVNKKDEYLPTVSENTLRDKYPAIKAVKYLSLKNDLEELANFRDELAEFIRMNPAWNKEIPALWFDMKEKMHKTFLLKKKDYIDVEEFRKIAKSLDICENDFVLMRKLLHDLGICLWYDKISQLTTFVINPNWISYGVYKIINWLNKNGVYKLWMTDFSEIFSTKEDKTRYPSEKYDFLFNIMLAYELAYPIKGYEKDGLIIPNLLNTDKPERGMDQDFPISDSLLMRYKMETTLPLDTITRFIVRHHKDISINDDKQPIVWRHGVKLDSNGNQALVIETGREIQLYVKGDQKSEYLRVLRATLDEIFKSYKSNNPTIEYKITTTGEQNPVYETDANIRAYVDSGKVYWDPKTRSDISLTKAALIYRIPHTVSVFVGSTYTDLKDYRAEIQKVLIRFEMIIKGMEYFGSTPKPPLEVCLKKVAESNIYIGVFAHRYGSIDENSGKSFTHLEYEEAQKLKLPSLIYIIDDAHPVSHKHIDDEENETKMAELKKHLKKHHTVTTFTIPQDLTTKIAMDLHDLLINMSEKQ